MGKIILPTQSANNREFQCISLQNVVDFLTEIILHLCYIVKFWVFDSFFSLITINFESKQSLLT